MTVPLEKWCWKIRQVGETQRMCKYERKEMLKGKENADLSLLFDPTAEYCRKLRHRNGKSESAGSSENKADSGSIWQHSRLNTVFRTASRQTTGCVKHTTFDEMR
jgi:hypothetical protein